MKKEEKNQFIDVLADKLGKVNNFYLADISNMNVETSTRLRRLCFKRNIQLKMVKNSLLKKAFEKAGNEDFQQFYGIMKGSTSIMFSEVSNDSAKLIAEFRRTSPKPILKGAWVQDTVFIGDDQLSSLINLKSKDELVGGIIAMLQSPLQNVMSALQSGGNNIAGIVKTLSDKTS
jgi:large subunit ribosomal protein L10